MQDLEILIVPLALGGFVGFWCLILKVLSLAAWGRLAKSYEARARPEGIAFRWRSARMASVNYSGCLTFVVAPEGLHLSTMFFFRPSHPPLLVPWSAIELTGSGVVFTEHADLRMALHGSLARELTAARKHVASASSV
jgi:hypothetical protein